MPNTKRIVITIGTSVASELINKGAPLIILYYVLRKIGIEEFGEAQFGITIMEIALPFILFGYNLHGTIFVGKNKNDTQRVSEIITDVVSCKLIHAFIYLAVVLTTLALSPTHWQYVPIVLALSFYLFFSAIELSWVQLGLQKMSIFSLMQMISKIPALIGILIFVQDSSDGLLYAVLLLSANALCCLMTTIHVARIYKPAAFSRSRLMPLFKRSLGFSVGFVLAGALERIDILVAEFLYGAKSVGYYAGQVRLAHSINQGFLVIGSTFFSEIVSVDSESSFKKHLDIGLWSILSLYFPIAFGVYFLGPEFVTMFLGSQFAGHEAVFSVLTIGLLANIFVFVYGWQVLYVQGQSRQVSIAMIMSTIVVLILTLVLGSLWNLTGVAMGSLIGRMVGAVLLLLFSVQFYALNFRLIGSAFFPAVVMAATLWLSPGLSFTVRAVMATLVLVVAHAVLNKSKIKSVLLELRKSGG